MPRTPARRRFRWLVLFGLVLSVIANPNLATYSKPTQQVSPVSSKVYSIKRVIDGDTFLLSNGQKVRLTGIDTPESQANPKARRDSERSGKDIGELTRQGKKATRFVKQLVEGKEIRVEYDVQRRDKYGRLLVYAYDISTLKNNPQIKLSKGIIVNAQKEIFINGSIIGSGYAVPLTIPPNVKHAHLFQKLYYEARSAKRGLWAP